MATSAENIKISDMLTKIKAALHISQAGIAAKLGVSEEALRQWKTGKSGITKTNRRNLERLYQQAERAEQYDVSGVEEMRQRMMGAVQAAGRDAIISLYEQVMDTVVAGLAKEFAIPAPAGGGSKGLDQPAVAKNMAGKAGQPVQPRGSQSPKLNTGSQPT